MRYQQTTGSSNTSSTNGGFLSWGETVTRVASAGPGAARLSWPDSVAYREAIQHPHAALRDPELRNADIVLDRRGLPVAYSGRFAIVFRLRALDGAHWALRCFTSAPSAGPGQIEREQRYRFIAQHTARMPEAFVPYRYIEQGIKVGPEWFPIVAMRWATGEPLGRWVERHLEDAEALRTLAGSLSGLLARLEEGGVAHGDWQHDNLLVAEDGRRVTLVDYDGMYVEELEGHPSDEMGHPNYQHPTRTAAHYGPGLDRFPCLVIQAALLGLARDPGLWNRFSDGESLLFKKQDFQDPAGSPLFRALRELVERTRDEQLADAVALLQDACIRDPREVLPPAVAPIAFTPLREGDTAAAAVENEDAPAVAAPRPTPAKPPGGKWWLGGNVVVPPLGFPLSAPATAVTSPSMAPSLSMSAGLHAAHAAAPQDTYAFIERAVRPETLRAEHRHLWGARASVLALAVFLFLCVYSLLSGGRHFPFYLFFWVFNLASLGYNAWPRRKVYDELTAEIVKMERMAAKRREDIAQRRSAVLQGGGTLAGYANANDYIADKLRQQDINRVLTVAGIAVSTLRQLRAEGITTALHLHQRTSVPDIPPHQMAALQQWVRDLEMEFAAEFRKQTAPHRQVPVDIARWEQEAAEFDRERDRLLKEKEQFPDVSFGTYALRLLGKPDPSVANVSP